MTTLEKIQPFAAGEFIVELGTGKGLFIKSYAQQYPEKNFLGVEKYQKWTKHAIQRIEKNGLTNVKIIKSTGEEAVELLSRESVDEYYILFPDPWPKRRHKPRRLIQRKMIEKLHSTLKKNGKLYIATDHKEYYDWIQEIMSEFLDRHFRSINDQKLEFASNYQIKYEKEGRAIYSLHVQKI